MATDLDVDDIAVLFGRAFTTTEEEQVEMYIGFAESEIETYLGRPIKIKTFSENCFPDANGVVYLHNTPVVSVTSLTVNGEAVDDDFLMITPYGLENIWEQVLNIRSYAVDVMPTDRIYEATINVTYRAGLDYPDAIKSLVASGVVRKMRDEIARTQKESSGQTGVKIIKVDDYSVEYFNDAATASSGSASSLSIYPSVAEFKTIERFKKQGVTY